MEQRASRLLGAQPWAPYWGTGHGPSVSWGDPVTQTGWEGCSVLAAQPCLHSPFPLLPALEITPSLCFPGIQRQCTLGLADRLPSVGPSPGTQVPSPGLQHRGQPSWQGAPGASTPCSGPTCLPRRHGRVQPQCFQPCTSRPVPCCPVASLSAGLASPGDGQCCSHAGTVAMVESGPVPGRHFAGQIPMLAEWL